MTIESLFTNYADNKLTTSLLRVLLSQLNDGDKFTIELRRYDHAEDNLYLDIYTLDGEQLLSIPLNENDGLIHWAFQRNLEESIKEHKFS